MSKGRGRRRRESPKRSKGATNALAQGGYGNTTELQANAAAGREERGRMLPPALHGLDDDDRIPVIITTGGEKPPDGGEYLGTMDATMTAEDGTVIAPGARVWLNTRPGAAEGTETTLTFTDLSPGLRAVKRDRPAGRRVSDILEEADRRGLPLVTAETLQKLPSGPPPAVRAARTGEAERVAALFGKTPGTLLQPPGIPPDVLRQLERASGKLTPEHIRDVAGSVTSRMARQLRTGTGQLAGFRDIPGIRENWSAADVLSTHADLAERYRHPSEALLDYLTWHMGGIHQAAGPRSVDMFYPVSPGAVPVTAHGRELAGLLAHGLVTAETYQVTAEMARSLETVLKRRGREITYLNEAELPGAAGFAWLDAPWVVQDMNGSELPVRAMSWERCSVRGDGITGWNAKGEPVAREDGRIMPAARLVLWSMIDDDATLNPEDYADPGSLAFDQAVLGPLRMVHVQPVPFGVRFHEEEAADGQPAVSVLAMVRVLWIFLGMTLTRSPAVARETVVPPRPDRRRMPKSLDHAKVHVITLRKYVTLSDELPVHREVERTCKWWVADFCRHIDSYEDYDDDGRRRRHTPVPSPRPGEDHDVCEICLARGDVIRVAPVRGHIRGPAWLPLKQPAHGKTLRRLAR
jgi:hypothetical protein